MSEQDKPPTSPLTQPQSAKEMEVFKEEVYRAVENARNDISLRYGAQAPKDKRLAYHNELHSFDVERRAMNIVHTINNALRDAGQQGISERDRLLTDLAIAYHDTVQESTIEAKEDGSQSRKYDEGNEVHSSVAALDFTEEVNDRLGRSIFFGSDRRALNSAIMSTVATFADGVVRQNELNKQSPLVSLVIAFADLGGAGMEGASRQFTEGCQLFFERNPDMVDKALGGQFATMSEGQKEADKRRVLSHFRSQEQYVRGRKNVFPEELKLVPEAARPAVQALFSHFDEAIKYMEQVNLEFGELSLEEIIDRMRPGLVIFSPEYSDKKKV